MKLRTDIVRGRDYFLVDMPTWRKLFSIYKGAPEIIFHKNDFQPFRLKVLIVDGNEKSTIESQPESNTFFISNLMGIRSF